DVLGGLRLEPRSGHPRGTRLRLGGRPRRGLPGLGPGRAPGATPAAPTAGRLVAGRFRIPARTTEEPAFPGSYAPGKRRFFACQLRLSAAGRAGRHPAVRRTGGRCPSATTRP